MLTMVERSFEKNVLQGKAGKKSLINEAGTTVMSEVSKPNTPHTLHPTPYTLVQDDIFTGGRKP